MASHTVFPLISGHLSLDFVNTELVKRGIRHDLLVTENDFVEWINTMKETGTLSPYQFGEHKISADGFRRLKELRSVLHDTFEEIAEGTKPSDQWITHLEELNERAPLSFKFISGTLEPIPTGPPEAALISLIAYDVIRLLASGDLLFLHRCANPDCVLLFMDRSGRRKWCSMKICGNRTKVARNQARRGNN